MRKVEDLTPVPQRISNSEFKVLKYKAYLNDTDKCPLCGVVMSVLITGKLEWIHPTNTDCRVKRVYYN
jgi:hypothetical protein